MKLSKIFCNNIKFYRFKNGYSQEKLGELTDLSARYISAIECGRYSPTINTIEKIAQALQIDAYLLFKEKNNINCLAKRVDIYKKEKK